MDNYEIVFESSNLYFIKLSKTLVNDYLDMISNPNIKKCLSLKDSNLLYKTDSSISNECNENYK